MQVHLQTGCRECEADLAAWMHIKEMAAREKAYQPPAAAVKMAKAASKLHGEPARPSIARLLFDSFHTPVVAGVRSSPTSGQPRQVLYGFDKYRVDLRFEPNFNADEVLLVGQVLNTAESTESLGPITIALTRGGQVLGTARTNEFGEFQLECDLGGRLELQLTLPGGATVKIPMVEPSASHDAKEPSQPAVAKRLASRLKAKKKSTRKKV